jgi:hypothetical protein
MNFPQPRGSAVGGHVATFACPFPDRVAQSPCRGSRNSDPRDSIGQEARCACSDSLWLQRLKRQVEDDLELMCS